MVAVVVAAMMSIAAGSALAQDASPLREQRIRAGRELARTHCASCHAIGASGKSHHPDAPPFRTLSQRYPIDSLAEAFGEGISVGHPDMPEWRFEPDQIDNLLAYLKSVQPKPQRKLHDETP